MLKNIITQTKPAIFTLLFLTILTGIVYPAFVTTIAQLIFPWQANGSLIMKNGRTVGSWFIGQSFTDPNYFYSRPSATTPFPYNSASSTGSNMGPSNPNFLALMKQRVANLQKMHSDTQSIPIDLVTASGSGLDPEISPAAAFYQAARIAEARHLSLDDVKKLIEQYAQNRQLGILGEPRVNVLELNLALDDLQVQHARQSS